MRQTIHASIAFASVFLMATFATAEEPPRLADSEYNKFSQRWADAQESFGVPGFSLVIVKGDQVIVQDAFGVRSTKDSPSTTPDTMFYIASCTKPFNAMAALKLVEEGRLDLDAPVKTYVPHFKLADAEAADTITVRDLLCHRPGLDSSPIVFNDAYSGQISDDLYFRLLSEVAPSGEVTYSNVHFTLLGRVIEAVTGQQWRDYLRDHVLEPAAMNRTTGYASKMYEDPNVALPMIDDQGTWALSPVRKTDRTMHAAGGMGTTAHDLGRWLRLNLNEGKIDGQQILSPGSVQQMQTLQSKFAERQGRIRQRVGFGLGWFVGNYRSNDHTYIDHGGGYVGTAAHVSFIPELDLGVGILANCSPGGQALCDIVSIDIYDDALGVEGTDLLPNYKKRIKEYNARETTGIQGSNPAEGNALTQDVQKYLGRYEHPDWGWVEFRLDEGELAGKCGDLNLKLVSNGPDEFVGVIAPGMTADGSFHIESGQVTAVNMETIDGQRAKFVKLP